MSLTVLMFVIFGGLTCGGAIGVVVSQKVVRMAIWLAVSLGSVAGLFFMLNADFVAATQLLIYVGGTVVLLVFGVMLTAGGPSSKIRTSPGEGVTAGAIGLLLLSVLVWTVASVDWGSAEMMTTYKQEQGGERRGYNPGAEGNTARPIGMALLGLRPDKDLGKGGARASTGYLLPFEIVSVHLLVVLVGAAYLARAKRRVNSSPTEQDA